MSSPDSFPRLVAGLRDPAAYPEPVTTVEERETHISHVFLAGDFAYKIKKPLDLGFLDFSAPEVRAHYCAEEVRLNGRLAPGIYVDTVAITGTPESPRVGGDGPPLETAVRMRRFDDRQRLDHELAAGRVDGAMIDVIGQRLACFHETGASASPPAECGTPAAVLAPMQENFEQIHAAIDTSAHDARLRALAEWTRERGEALAETLTARREAGRVRECHGDLHLGNMVRMNSDVAIFDGIEFNAALRWIDVASDLAFLIMDLDRLERPDLAGRVLDEWLAGTGDYQALIVLRFYLVYRAMVRAKIHAIRAAQADTADTRAESMAAFTRHLDLAARYTDSWAPALLITRGISGTGKSTAARALVERIGAVRLRSDVERLRLFADAAPAERYSEAASDTVHERLATLADHALGAGWPTIIDATLLEQRRRTPFFSLAERHGAPIRILDLHLPAALRDERLRRRAERQDDPSEADAEIAARQEQALEPLTEAEARVSIRVDNDGAGPRVPATGLRHARGEATDTEPES